MIDGTPGLRVEILCGVGNGWTLNAPGLSQLDAGNLIQASATGWENVSCSVTNATWRRGQTDSTAPYRPLPGFATVQLWDPDRNLDPNYPPSPYYSRLRAGIGVRIVAETSQYFQNDIPMFTGRLWGLSWSDDYATLEVSDALGDIGRANVNTSTIPPVERGITRIARVLDAAGLSMNVQQTLIGTGVDLQAADLAGNAIQTIEKVCLTEWSLFYANGSGQLLYGPGWFKNSRRRFGGLAEAECAWILATTRSKLGFDLVRNQVTGQANGLTDITKTNSISADRYGLTSWNASTLCTTAADLNSWALTVLGYYTNSPQGFPQTIVLNPALAETEGERYYWWKQIVNVDNMGSSIEWALDGSSWSGQIVGESHNYDPERGWQVTYQTAPQPYVYSAPRLMLDAGAQSFLNYGNVLA
jgi:hypothetical protein